MRLRKKGIARKITVLFAFILYFSYFFNINFKKWLGKQFLPFILSTYTIEANIQNGSLFTIRTFYNEIGNAEQKQQIELWKKSWEEFGWNTKVLTLEDAKRHPSYPELSKRIESFSTCSNRHFQLSCFMRWLAFAVDGDGWMSDYDLLPLDFHPSYFSYDLPNEGMFTSHDVLLAPLVSASGNETEKMLDCMISTVEKHAKLKTRGTQCRDGSWQITDQEALIIIRTESLHSPISSKPFLYPTPGKEIGIVLHVDDLVKRISTNQSDCPREFKAVHFSGRPNTLFRDHRVKLMEDILSMWKIKCRDNIAQQLL